MTMVMSRIWTGMIFISILCGILTGQGTALGAAAMEGAQAGISLGLSMAGAICLWTGVGYLLSHIGITDTLAKLLFPILKVIFPDTRQDKALSRDISANLCANLLGLGNAATPMGISAVRRMKQSGTATDQMCRLIVLNTASIQLLPTNLAAVRLSLGCSQPFDILPAVWVSSFCSAALGITAAWVLGKVWPHD